MSKYMTNSNATILLADDSAFMRNVLKSILQNGGYANFIEASDGQEAIKQINEKKPDLVLLDMIMPNLGGIEVLKAVGKKVKIIVVSAVGQEKMIEEAKQLGATGYVVKPFDNAKVIEEVKAVLG